MDWLLYLRPFLAGFSIALVLLSLLWFFVARDTLTKSRLFSCARRFGGGAVILSFFGAIFLNDQLVMTSAILGILAGAFLLLCFGIWDDRAKLGWRVQLVFQILASGILLIFGLRITSLPIPFLGQIFVNTIPGGEIVGFVVLVVWCVLLMNVLNWADGIDGLLPSISLVSFFVIFVLSLAPHVNQPPIAILSIAIFGSMLGLFLFNSPPAKIFAGTSGSFFAGFALAALSVLSGTKIATALLVLLLPIVDAVWVFCERLFSGVSPFCGGDFRHLHYRLRDIGWSDRRIVLWYTFFTMIVGALALSTNAFGKTVSFLVVSVLTLVFLSWVRKTARHEL